MRQQVLEQTASMQEHLKRLDVMIGESVDRHTKDVQNCDTRITEEQAERERHHSAFQERVDALERSAAVLDGILRTELTDRTAETKRLWEALDNRTYDLSLNGGSASVGSTAATADTGTGSAAPVLPAR